MKNIHFSLSNQFKALSDENRLRVLCVIYDKKKVCVSDIAEKLNISIAIVSHHLHALEKAGILWPSKEGKKVCYMLVKNNFTSDLKRLVCKYK